MVLKRCEVCPVKQEPFSSNCFSLVFRHGLVRPARATMGLSLSVQLQFKMSLTITTALESSTAKPWLVSLAKESDCTMSLTAMELSAVKPWLVKPESSNSAAFHAVSFAFPFTALELSALKPCLVMPTGESDCRVTDCVSHVKRPQPHMMLSSSSTHIHMRTQVIKPNKYGKNAIYN